MEAKKTVDSTTKYYFNKLGGEELFEMLSLAVENSAELIAWLKGRETETQQYTLTRLEKNSGKLFLEYNPGFLKPKKSIFTGHKIFLKIGLGKIYIFGHAKLHQKENQEYFLETSSEFYKSQQRENLRVESHPNLDLNIKLNIGEKNFTIYDLSASGASFYVKEDQEADFEKGKTYAKVIITVESESFKITRIEVVKSFQTQDKKWAGFKCIAVKFLDLSTEEETKLVVKLTALKRKIELKKKGKPK